MTKIDYYLLTTMSESPNDPTLPPASDDAAWEERLTQLRNQPAAACEAELKRLVRALAGQDELGQFRCVKRLLNPSDRTLRNMAMLAILAGDNAGLRVLALSELTTYELEQLRRYLCSRDLADVADEALSFALDKVLEKLAPESGTTIKNLREYLRQVATRKAWELKKKSIDGLADGLDEQASVRHWTNSLSDQDSAAGLDALAECQRTVISPQESKILELFFVQEATGHEVAEHMSLRPSTVYHWRKRAMEKLRICVQGKLG